MAKRNVKKVPVIETTHGGAKVRSTGDAEKQLRRAVMACLLWEDSFYESGESIADRIKGLIPNVDADKVAEIAVEARTKMNLRHVPLLVTREMARYPEHRTFVKSTLDKVIGRADELGEFLSIYWQNGKQPLSAQVKKGLASAFTKFDEYQLAKYNRDAEVKLRDVLFLTHPKPVDQNQAAVWTKLVDGTLASPDTWEVNLSAGKDKKDTFTRLITENKLGAMALLRNLRNMVDAGVDIKLIESALDSANYSRVLPFRFFSAAANAPKVESLVEKALFKCTSQHNKLLGKTILVVDVSGSMYGGATSVHSSMDRARVATSLAVLVRELCEESAIYATAGSDTARKHQTKEVPARRGFALSDAIYGMCHPLGGGGIFLTQCLDYIKPIEKTADRIIVITDEQDCDDRDARSPEKADAFGKSNYIINVASYQNGVGYHPKWNHIDGFSASVLDYIAAFEGSNLQ